MLYTYDFALDILSLHLKITDLVFEALELLYEYDCETIGTCTSQRRAGMLAE